MTQITKRRVGWYVLIAVLYLISTVPVGFALYGLKEKVGIDIFKMGGFHAYMQCLDRSFPLGKGAHTVTFIGKHQG